MGDKIEFFVFVLLGCMVILLTVASIRQAAIIGIYEQMIIDCEVPRQIDRCFIIAQPE